MEAANQTTRCYNLADHTTKLHLKIYTIQGVSGGIVNILGGGSVDYSE